MSNLNDDDRTVFVNYENEDVTMEATVESPLDQAYRELGQQYYEGRFEDPLPELLPLFEEITKLRNQEMISQNKCPQCGSPILGNAMFCGNCGYRLR